MIVDSSALLAVIFREPHFEVVLGQLESADALGMGTPSLTEASLVLAAPLSRREPAIDREIRAGDEAGRVR